MIKCKFISENEVVATTSKGYKFTMPVCNLSDSDLRLIGFDSMGNNQLIQSIASDLIDTIDLSKVDVIVCPEAKSIPLAQEVSRQLGIDYFVLRKSYKAYMKKPMHISVKSITTGSQSLWYDEELVKQLQHRNVMLFDDVVSTGSSFRALERFAESYDLRVTNKVAIFREGVSIERKDIDVIGILPLLYKDEIQDWINKEFYIKGEGQLELRETDSF